MASCPNCSAAMPAGFLFCGTCGADLRPDQRLVEQELGHIWPGTYLGWV